jgi:hypothetical protein
VKSIRDANATRLSVQLDHPTLTRTIRVKVLRELYEGQARQLADLESIRVLDTAGRDVSTRARPDPISMVAETDDLREAAAGLPMASLPMAVQVKPNTAEVIARFVDSKNSPAIYRNRYGQGQAILVTTSESSFGKDDPFWHVLRRLTIGEPTMLCDATVRDRYCILLTKVDGRHVLHVIDREAAVGQGARGRGPETQQEKSEYRAGDTTFSLHDNRLGNVTEARLIGAKEPLPMRMENGFVTLTVRPDPVASVVLQ